MEPGHKFSEVLEENECVRMSVACILGVPREDIKAIRVDNTVQEWLDEWDAELFRLGYERELFHPNGENEPDGFWIAGVKDLKWGDEHAIVMKGKQFWFDPAFQRSQRPHRFVDGWRLVPRGNN